jgi:hypothetical protein
MSPRARIAALREIQAGTICGLRECLEPSSVRGNRTDARRVRSACISHIGRNKVAVRVLAGKLPAAQGQNQAGLPGKIHH